MRGYRRLLPPILTVVGFLICVYAAFFFGVKQDMPVPSGAEPRPASVSQQNTIVSEWSQTQNWQSASVNVYQVREKPEAAASFYTKAFHNLGWTDAPNPGQPKDLSPTQTFTTLGFNKGKQQLIVALSNGEGLNGASTPFAKVLKTLYTGTDNLAILINGTLK